MVMAGLVGMVMSGGAGAVAQLPTNTPKAVATWTATHTPEPAATWTPTHTPEPPTSTPKFTDTPIPPTDTPIPPTDTPIPPTDTPIPPTDTPIPPTDTPQRIADSPTPSRSPQSFADMILIPAGEFIMGSDTEYENEKPQHTVNLAAYYIDKYEVINALYAECVAAGKCSVPKCDEYKDEYKKANKANHPVVCVDGTQAKSYCEYAGKRLPTEAEWEKAARGTDGRNYPWGNEFDGKKLNYFNVRDTTQVGSYPSGASPYGVMDMAGNVEEWVSSDYKAYPYIANDGREDLLSNNSKVIRGGGWNRSDFDTRAAYRNNYASTSYNSNNLGFRCAQ